MVITMRFAFIPHAKAPDAAKVAAGEMSHLPGSPTAADVLRLVIAFVENREKLSETEAARVLEFIRIATACSMTFRFEPAAGRLDAN
jgi:hypothetical protein